MHNYRVLHFLYIVQKMWVGFLLLLKLLVSQAVFSFSNFMLKTANKYEEITCIL